MDYDQMHKVRKMVDVKVKIALGLIAITILAAPIAIAQEVPPHVVISGVYPNVVNAHSEWIELYNPTAEDVDIGGWSIDTATHLADATIPTGAIIPAHGFYLIADESFSTEKDDPSWPDADLEEAITLTDGHGWCRLNDSGSVVVDTVGWGTATTNETLNAVKPAKGKSIERESLDEGYAPCQDTDNNYFDFFVQDTPTPKNSSSQMAPAPVGLFDAADKLEGCFVKIQDAVDNASVDYTIRVDNGTYEENVVVDKQLTICSEFGAAVTTIQASDSNDHVIDVINADNVKITGFNVTGATGKGGIHLDNADYCNIANNSASNNNIGIHLQPGSRDNTISNNNVSDNGNGIWLASSNSNTITNNYVSDNGNGIRLRTSDDNIIYNNYFDNTNNAVDDDNNIWNIAKTGGPNIIGGLYLGGNYWSDYTGADIDKDGLGNFLLPYNSKDNIENGGDSHPLVPVGSAPILSIEKSDEPDPVPPGGTLNYTIIVENTGNATATDVNVTETYDANVTFASAVPAPSKDDNTWIFTTLNVSESKRINISVTVNSSTPVGTTLYNSVNVSCDENVTDTYTEETTVFALALSVPDIELEKWVKYKGEPDSEYGKVIADARVCDNVTFKIVVHNNGTNLSDIVVTDVLNCSLGYIDGSANIPPNTSEIDCPYNQTLIWKSEKLEHGKYINFTFDAHVDECGNDTNYAHVVAKNESGFSVSDNDTVWVNCTPPVCVVTATEIGSACFKADAGTIVDLEAVDESTLPEDEKPNLKFPYGFFKFNITGLEDGQTVNVTITLPRNAPEGTEYWKYHVSEGGGIWIPMGSDDGDNVINITLVDGGLGDDDDEENGRIVDQGGPGGKPPKIIGFAPVNTTIYDPAGACRTFSVTVDQMVDVDWYLEDVPWQPTNQSVRNASFYLCRTKEGEFNITASAENIYSINPATQSWTWIVKPTNISVTKVADVTEAKPSTNVTFTITLNNTGNTTLNRIVVEDQLREGLNYSKADPRPDAITPGQDINGKPVTNVIWYFNGSLAVNDSIMFTLVANILENAKGVLTNRVVVTGWPENGTNVTDDDIAKVNVIGVTIKKSCTSSVAFGGTVTYTITYSNSGKANLTDVVIIEHYPDDLTFDSADPAPDSGTNNTWTIGNLPVGGSGTIKITMKVPDTRSDLSYEESGSVAGDGIVIISKEMSTDQKPYELENIVTISGSCNDLIVNATASAITTLGASGSSLELREHGSGSYESEEESRLSLKTGRIEFDKYTKAEYRPTTFNCSDGFAMGVTSKWSQDICIKNYAKTSAIRKTITEATALEDNTRIDTTNTGYTMDFDSKFSGYLHVDKWTLSKPKKPKVAATSEHYIGEFEIKNWDEKGDKSEVEGVGYVIVDKELDTGRVLLMEHGSGIYSSEEDSTTTRIAKTTYAVYEPTSFNFSDSFVVNFSSKWMQDFCVKSSTTATKKNRGTRTLLHKKIRDATYIDDDTIAKRGSLKFDTFFYGATHIGSKSRYSRASEDYIGEFYISWGARTDCTFVFDWDDVPGADDDKLIKHLSEPNFHMPWVTDDDVVITKPVNNTIKISSTGHSAEIILDTETNESAELIVDGVDTYTFEVVKHGDTLKVYDCELEKKPEEVIGEGFVMIDEAIFKEGEIQVTEHGSGIYHSYEDFGTTSIEKETYGVYKPTYFEFSDSFAVNFSSKWMQDICAKDKAKGTAIHKKISDASFMKDDTIVAKRSLNFTSSFNGSMHIGARTGDIKISEDYIGEFNVTQLIKMVKGKRPTASSKTSDWLSCPCPIPSSTYPWVLDQYPTPTHHWICPSIAP